MPTLRRLPALVRASLPGGPACGGAPADPPPIRRPCGAAHAKRGRAGLAHQATTTLQGIVLLVGVALIVVLLRSQSAARARHPEPVDRVDRTRLPMLLAGQVATREDLRWTDKVAEESADPQQVESALPAGRTHEIHVKGALTAALKKNGYGAPRQTNLAFAFEMVTERTIQRNDGRRIVAVLRFGRVRMVKLLSDVDDLEIDLGAPGEPILDELDHLAPETGIAVVDVAPVAYGLLGERARSVAESPASRAYLETDSLSGKTVRITYRTDVGVETVEPMGCVLNNWQVQFLFRTPLLSDHSLLPPEESTPGAPWRVNAHQLAGYLEPSMRCEPKGEVVVQRVAEYHRDGRQYSTFQVQGDTMYVVSRVYGGPFVSRLQPTGTVQFDLSEGHVAAAQWSWRIDEASFSGRRLLFESEFEGRPMLEVRYCCKLR